MLAYSAYPDEVHQGVVYMGSSGEEETAARAQFMEEKQLLVLQRKKTRGFRAADNNISYQESFDRLGTASCVHGILFSQEIEGTYIDGWGSTIV